MQSIIILKEVDVPDMPRFNEGQKVNVADSIADALVERGHAKYDQAEKPTTDRAKKVKEDFDQETEAKATTKKASVKK